MGGTLVHPHVLYVGMLSMVQYNSIRIILIAGRYTGSDR